MENVDSIKKTENSVLEFRNLLEHFLEKDGVRMPNQFLLLAQRSIESLDMQVATAKS
jgi:hypothetical protein